MHLCIFVFVASFPALSTLEPGCILAASLQDHGQHTATALQHSVFVRVCICISIMILVCIFVTIWDRIWVTTWICICVNTWVYLCVIIWEVCNVEDESIFFVKKKSKKLERHKITWSNCRCKVWGSKTLRASAQTAVKHFVFVKFLSVFLSWCVFQFVSQSIFVFGKAISVEQKSWEHQRKQLSNILYFS